jgi:hypothetical protein
MFGMPQKHIEAKPILTSLKKESKRKAFNEVALFFLGYSNRILYKAGQEIKHTFQLPILVNTIHIRYLLILSFLGEFKTNSKRASLREIEYADFPARSKKSKYRIKYMQELVDYGFVSSEKPFGKTDYFKVTDKGRLAIDLIVSNMHLCIHTHPTSMNVSKKSLRISMMDNIAF